MTHRRTFLQAGAAAGGTLAFPYLALGQSTVSLRMQGFLPATSHVHKAFEKMAGELKNASKGALNVTLLPAGGAVAVTETLNAVANGILDGHYSAPSFFAARDPAFALLGDTGAAYNDLETRNKWFTEGGGLAVGREVYDRYGLYMIGTVYWPQEHLVAKRAVTSVEEMKGLKVRCPPGLIAEMLSRAGAAVVNLPGGEVFNALQTGVIDAADWASPALNNEAGLYRTAKFSVSASHSMPLTDVSLSKKRWEALPADLKKLFEQHVAKMNADITKTLREEDEKAIAALKEGGGQVIRWAPAEIAKLRGVTKRVQQEWGARNALARKVYDSLHAHMGKVGLNT